MCTGLPAHQRLDLRAQRVECRRVGGDPAVRPGAARGRGSWPASFAQHFGAAGEQGDVGAEFGQAFAAARPMPWLAPQTRACLPVRSRSMSSVFRRGRACAHQCGDLAAGFARLLLELRGHRAGGWRSGWFWLSLNFSSMRVRP